ncbi:MAG: hypothetical protein ACETVZ_02240 [Phycisphaerae bacterium]
MKKLAVLSLALLLVIGLFVTGSPKEVFTPDKDKKPEAKAPAEKAERAPTEKADKASAEKK